MSDQKGEKDITFEFKQFQVTNTNCNRNTDFNNLRKNIQWFIYPSGLNIENVQVTFVETSLSFQVIIPKAETLKFPADEFVTFVAYVNWDNPAQA